MEKVFVVRRVASKLHATETAIDNAMTQAAELMADALAARKELNLSAVVVDDASAKIVAAIKALGEARTAMVEAHSELNEVKLRIGVRTKMDIEEKPPLLQDAAQTTLREVG
jgi:hypothetical protein